MDITDVYTLILHDIPIEDIPAEAEHIDIISKFRPYETSRLSSKDISQKTGLNRPTVKKLRQAYQDDKAGFPFGIRNPRKKIEHIIIEFLRVGYTKKEIASELGFCTKNIPFIIGETTIPHGNENYKTTISRKISNGNINHKTKISRKISNGNINFFATFAGYSTDSFSKRLMFSDLKDDTGNLISRNIVLRLTNEFRAINLEIGDIVRFKGILIDHRKDRMKGIFNINFTLVNPTNPVKVKRHDTIYDLNVTTGRSD